MPYNNKSLAQTVGNQPVPQYYNEKVDQYEVLKGENGGSYVFIKNAYDPKDDMMKIKSLQKKFRDSFTGVAIDPDKWDFVVGTGATISVSAGQLTMGAGTTVNEITYLLSKEVFTIPLRLSIGFILSQRIANQSFIVELVSVDPVTGIPDNQNICAFVFDGTTATQGKYRVQNGGLTPLDSAAVTLPTTAASGVYEIEPFADECWFHGSTLDSTAARSNSYRRHQQIPDPNALYKIRIKWVNGGTAPASNTNAVIQYVAAQDYAELTAEITAGRGQSVAGQSMGVIVSPGSTAPSGTHTIAGVGAHDATDSGNNPVKIGAKAVNVNPSPVSATGDIANIITTMLGVPIVRPYSIPEGDWQFACSAAIAVNTDTVMSTAGAAGIRNYLTGLQIKNTNATPTEVVVKDGSTVIWRGYLPANMSVADAIVFPTPLRGTAATALNFTCLTAGASVYVSAQGYKAP